MDEPIDHSIQETDAGSLAYPSFSNAGVSLPPNLENVLASTDDELRQPGENAEGGFESARGSTALSGSQTRHTMGASARRNANSTNVNGQPNHPYYVTYDARIRSFKPLQARFDTVARQSAESGFYFDRGKNTAICYHCGGSICLWKPGIDPFQEHLQKYPDCDYVKKQLGTGSDTRHGLGRYNEVEDIENGQVQRRNMLDAPSRQLEMSATGFTSTENKRKSKWTSDDKTFMDVPKHWKYASLESREHSFNNWSSPSGITSRQMAEAGLFYTGESDITRCFYCGESLHDWEQGDDPVQEHRRLFPTCYNIQRLGRERQTNFVEKERSVRTGDHMESSIAQAALQMGYPRKTVEEAIAKLREISGNEEITVEALMDIILSDEERRDAEKDRIIQRREAERVQRMEQINQALRRQNNDLRASKTCRVCYEITRDTTLLPCGHFACCSQCAENLTRCPVCRREISGRVKTYYA